MKINISNKFIVVFSIICIMLSLFSNVYASELQTNLNIIQKASETKYLDNNQGYISKTIVDSNEKEGEVTIELKLSNTKKAQEKKIETEIFLVIDNSPSMDFVTSTGRTRKEIILDSATKLVNSIFENSNNVKMGLIDFHGYNGKVRQALTNSKETVLAAMNKQKARKTEGGTNIDAGLQTAQKNFSKANNNKIIILLTDGIPNYDVNGTYASDRDDVTDPGCVQIGKNTKQTLLNFKKSNIYTITLLTGMSETDRNTDKDGNVFEDKNTVEEELQAAENIFGTSQNPTADKYYLVNNTNIDKRITEDIFRDVIKIVQNPINTVKIVDYFPKDIMENFDFSYVENPKKGTVSEKIDDKTNTITWNIDTIKGDEVVSLKYKLKIKDMKNMQLLNKTISTNEKVVLTYKDIESKDYMAILSSSPRIQLEELKNDEKNPSNNQKVDIKKENLQANEIKDNEVLINKIPFAGKISYAFVFIVILSLIIISYKMYEKYKGI